MLDEFKVSREKTFKRLSRGQKTLLSIALALSHEADLLILDEPTAGLDIVLRRTILERLRGFAADGERTVVVASHITDGLEEIAEYVNFLDEREAGVPVRKGRAAGPVEADPLQGWRPPPRPGRATGRCPPTALRELGAHPRTFPPSASALAAGIARGDVKVENARLDDILIAMHQGE